MSEPIDSPLGRLINSTGVGTITSPNASSSLTRTSYIDRVTDRAREVGQLTKLDPSKPEWSWVIEHMDSMR